MRKTEVIVDTCFLQKLSSEGKAIDNVKRILTELEYIPVVHPYIYEYELSLYSYFVRLVEEKYIRVISYNEFQKDTADKQTYEDYYEPQTGWGETLANFFGGEVEERSADDCDYGQARVYEADNAIVENRAIGGRSSKSFVEEGKLDDLLEDIRP